jgi:LEA14-like dessication related protein
MTSRRTLLILAGALTLAGGCGTLQHPEIRAVRAHVTGLDLQRVSLKFEVDIHNPYPVALRAPQFHYGIDVADAEFVKSQAPVEVAVPPGQVGTVTLPAQLEYAQLWRTYRALADASEVKYRLHGTVPVSALGQTYELPLSHSGTFPVLRLPQIQVDRVDFSDVSLSQANATVAATIRNPNAFALGAQGLGYALRFADTPVGSLRASTPESIPAGGTGKLQLTGTVTARSALLRILQGGSFTDAQVAPTGTLQTPFGPVSLANGAPPPQ